VPGPRLIDSASDWIPDDAILALDLEHARLLPGPALRALHLERERGRVRATLDAGGLAVAGDTGLALYRPLPWDSSHFGMPCADLCRLYLAADTPSAEAGALLAPLLAEARRRGIRFLSARLLTTQTGALAWLLEASAGFRLVDTSVELGAILPLPASSASAGVVVRDARGEDLPRLTDAVRGFVANRFHRDQRIPRERATAVYLSWVEAALRGEHGRLLTCELGTGEVAGCVSFVPADGALGVGTLGLVVVDPAHRGRGLLAAMVEGCVARTGGRALVTSTQVGNLSALRSFARSGLLPIGARHVLHAIC
jgi:GNAT superfamily N-acetyltransferase